MVVVVPRYLALEQNQRNAKHCVMSLVGRGHYIHHMDNGDTFAMLRK